MRTVIEYAEFVRKAEKLFGAEEYGEDRLLLYPLTRKPEKVWKDAAGSDVWNGKPTPNTASIIIRERRTGRW